MKTPFLFFLLFLPLCAHPQLSDDVQILYSDFTTFSEEQKPGGPTVMNRDAYSRFTKICNAATEDELLHIEKIGDIVVREYIVKTLVDRKSTALFSLFEKYVTEPKVEFVVTGTDTYDWNLAIELYASVANQKEKLERRAYYEKTTSKSLLTDVKQLFGPEYETNWTIEEVDSLLVKFDRIAFGNDDVAPEVLNHIFRYRNFRVADHQRVRKYADKHQTPEILATLANFKNPKDLPLFQTNFSNAFLAVANYPHPSFLPELKKRLNSQFANAEFQEAVSSYCNVDSRNLLHAICQKITATYPDGTVREEKLFALYGIMERHNYVFYKPVLNRIDVLLN